MTQHKTLEKRYAAAEVARTEILDRARYAASISSPSTLPPEGYTKNEKLPDPYQSLLSRGITHLEGLLLLAIFPPGQPWFQLKPSSRVMYDPSVDEDTLQEIMARLHLRELQIIAKLEHSSNTKDSRRNAMGFRSRQRQAIRQIVTTGGCLQMLTRDYRIRNFRRDAYVTKRDAAGDVVWHGTKEEIDPLTLSDEQIAGVGLNKEDLLQKTPEQRKLNLFTFIDWNPQSQSWTIAQEVNGYTLPGSESQEKISPYFETVYSLPPNFDYGIGIIEEHLGDATSVNKLALSVLEYGALASRHLVLIDESSNLNIRDLATKPNGSFVAKARVRDGKAVDIAPFQLDKYADFRVVAEVMKQVENRLGAVFAMDSVAQPQGERVTATQIQRIARELDGALGGAYAAITDQMQKPLLARVIYQMEQDKLFPPLPDGSVDVEPLTGIAALSREADAGKLLQTFQILVSAGPEMAQRFDMNVFIDTMLRYLGVHVPGLVKDAEQVSAEQQQAISQQLQLAAGQRAIEAVGNVSEQQLAAGLPQ